MVIFIFDVHQKGLLSSENRELASLSFVIDNKVVTKRRFLLLAFMSHSLSFCTPFS